MLWRYVRLPCLRRGLQTSIRRHEPLITSTRSFPLPCPLRAKRDFSAAVRGLSSSNALDKHEGMQETSSPESIQPVVRLSKLLKNTSLAAQPPSSNETIRISGNVRSKRTHGDVAFVRVSDGSTFESMQAVLPPDAAKDISNGAYVELEGIWKESLGKGQTHELQVTEVVRVGVGNPESSPIQKKSMPVDHLRVYPHLRLRTPLYSLLARVRHQVINSIHDFYAGAVSTEHEAFLVQPPLITSSDCEGAGEVFTITPKLRSSPHVEKEEQKETHYFRTPKYLTVSSQLHLEAYSAELGNVWTLSPAFRAEESDTGRHLAELYMLEWEGRGVTEITDLTSKVQSLIQHIVTRLANHRNGRELLSYYSDSKFRPIDFAKVDVQARWDALIGDGSSSWQTVTYAEAIDALQEEGRKSSQRFQYAPSWESGLQLEHERWIVEHMGGNKPVFVTKYPKAQKPFYMLSSLSSDEANGDNQRQTVECFDLLLPYGTCELVGGSLREHRLEKLIDNMRPKGLLASGSDTKSDMPSTTTSAQQVTRTKQPSTASATDYPYLRKGESLNSLQWYADLRRFGSAPHGGFGLGFDRLLMYLTGVNNVRDVVAFPRTYKNCIA